MINKLQDLFMADKLSTKLTIPEGFVKSCVSVNMYVEI